jgi:poly(3-hydroxybutyrate) depolymerase
MQWTQSLLFLFNFLGISVAAAAAPKIESGFLDREITLNGVSYRYQVYVPVNYDPGKSLPVILYLHSIAERGEDGL